MGGGVIGVSGTLKDLIIFFASRISFFKKDNNEPKVLSKLQISEMVIASNLIAGAVSHTSTYNNLERI